MKKYFIIFILFFSCLVSFAQVNLTSSLVACYGLDGNAKEPINNLSGTLSAVNPVTGHTGATNTAIHFNGTPGSIITLPANSLLKTQDFTFAAWIKADTLMDMSVLFTRNTTTISGYPAYYALNILKYNGLYTFAALRQNPYTGYYPHSSTIIKPNTWYHVAFTTSSVSLKVFVNGVFESGLTIPSSVTFTYDVSKSVILGGTTETPLAFFKGSIDNALFYSRSLTAVELMQIYSQDVNCNSAATGITEYKDVLFTKVFPNPGTGTYTLNISEREQLNYEVINSLGKIIESGEKNSGDLFLDFSDLANGIYFVKIKCAGKMQTSKIIKQ